MSQEGKELQAPPRTFWELVDGHLQEVDMFTGEVINRTKRPEDLMFGAELHPDMTVSQIQWVYTEKIAQVICGLVAGGDTITKICKRPGFPSNGVLARWRAERTDFDYALGVAMKSRAELYHDKVADGIDEDIDKDDVSAENLKFSKLKWLASVNDRRKFGGNVTTKDESGGNVTIIIDTGIKE